MDRGLLNIDIFMGFLRAGDYSAHQPVRNGFLTMKLRFVLGGLLLLLWLSFTPPALAVDGVNPQLLHRINRLSFGLKPGELERVQNLGSDRYLQEQLRPKSIRESANLTMQLNQLESLNKSPSQLYRETRPRRSSGQRPSPEELNAAREKENQILSQSVIARLLRANSSNRQLQEVLTNFWFNHFNVFSGKALTRIWTGAYEEQAIRPHTLGKFRQLLGATARHPAMLFYLDNWQNTADNANLRGRFCGLNENYARELMELHTLGVDAGYTQSDVITLAKIFTGWGFPPKGQNSDQNYGFYFDPTRHDRSDKVFLGQAISGGGIEEGEKALDILAKHPATARYISYKLAQYFVADEPPASLVDRLASKFLETDGDLSRVLKSLFSSPEFNEPRFYQGKFKTPLEYVISATRAIGVEAGNWRVLQGYLSQMGMPIYGRLTPDGYPQTQGTWLNPDAVTRRINFATILTGERSPVLENPPASSNPSPPSVDATRLVNTLGNNFSRETQAAIAASPPRLKSAILLGSPEFMYH